MFSLCSIFPRLTGGAAMDTDITRLKQNIAHIRRDIRLQAVELQQLIDADLDCTAALND
jgi:hypothetical protein